jgi:hypothetical protein
MCVAPPQTLEHPNIIRYIDAFIENNDLMLIFEYAEVRNTATQRHAATDVWGLPASSVTVCVG